MTGPKKLFEPITDDQIKKIHARARQINLADESLYEMVAKQIGIPSITALSKQEAIYLIERLQGQTKWLRPTTPRTEAEIPGDTATLPYFYHVLGIRLYIKALGWDKDHLKNWLAKYMKAPDIRSLDRKQAIAAYVALKNMTEDRDKKAGN